MDKIYKYVLLFAIGCFIGASFLTSNNQSNLNENNETESYLEAIANIKSVNELNLCLDGECFYSTGNVVGRYVECQENIYRLNSIFFKLWKIDSTQIFLLKIGNTIQEKFLTQHLIRDGNISVWKLLHLALVFVDTSYSCFNGLFNRLFKKSDRLKAYKNSERKMSRSTSRLE